MLYELHNCPKKIENQVHEAMSFVVNLLSLPENVWVDIEFQNGDQSLGGCVDMEDGDFLIDINKRQPLKELIVTLFHEMKHVEQTATGRLNQTIWDGISYKDTPYLERPWEKEAYEFESKAISTYKGGYYV